MAKVKRKQSSKAKGSTKSKPNPARPQRASSRRRNGRDDFSVAVLRLIANEVGNLCSNPGCGAPTSGPSRSRGSSNVGTGAHITAAAAGGPRYDRRLTIAERKAAENAIWLCARCGRLVDNDDSTYTVDDLHDWKAQAIARAHRALETGKVPEPGPSAASIEHDKGVFARTDAVMGERPLRDHIEALQAMAAMEIGEDRFIDDWVRLFDLEGTQYLVPALRSSSHEVVTAIRALNTFVLAHFFTRGAARRIYLRPNLNIDLEGSGSDADMLAFDKYLTELYKRGDDVLARYSTYRRAVKEHLFL